MELYDLMTPVEHKLGEIADAKHIPLGGSMELLPLCNLNCRMCYVHMSPAEMNRAGSMLSCGEWLAIAESAKKAGVIFLLLTGGEPLLYPGFRELYTALGDMGFVLTINTNGSLIGEDWADFFASRPCRRMNISLYGPDRETYRELCGDPDAFDKTLHGLELLKERNVPYCVNVSVTPQNAHKLGGIYEVTNRLGVHAAVNWYMFPPVRRNGTLDEGARLSPKEAATVAFENFRYANPGQDIRIAAKNTLQKLGVQSFPNKTGFVCRAGRSGFWMNWRGELLPCGMIESIAVSLKDRPFADAWREMSEKASAIHRCEDCESCPFWGLCSVCAASCYAETGSTAGRPEYQCETAKEFVRLLSGTAGVTSGGDEDHR